MKLHEPAFRHFFPKRQKYWIVQTTDFVHRSLLPAFQASRKPGWKRYSPAWLVCVTGVQCVTQFKRINVEVGLIVASVFITVLQLFSAVYSFSEVLAQENLCLQCRPASLFLSANSTNISDEHELKGKKMRFAKHLVNLEYFFLLLRDICAFKYTWRAVTRKSNTQSWTKIPFSL